MPPFRGRGYPGGPPPPRWHHQGYNRPRARGHNNYGRNDYNNLRGQSQGRSRPRPFIRLSNRGGRYYFNERQGGYDQGQGRGRSRARGQPQGHRGRGRGHHLSLSPSSGSDSDEETEYQKKIQGMVDSVDDNMISEVFQEMIIGKNIDSARRFLTWGLKHGTSRLALELLMRKHRRQMVLKRSSAIPSTNNCTTNDSPPSNEDPSNQIPGSDNTVAPRALTEFYNILQKIFSYLPAKQLNKCARVCKEWQRVADLVKKSRDERLLGVYFGWHLGKTMDQMFADPIEDMAFEAQFALISNTDSLQYGGLASQKVKLWSSAFIHNRSDPLCYLDDYLEVLLPIDCRIHGFTGARIVGTTFDGTTHDAGKSDDNAKVAWCLLFPKSPRLRIYDFALTDEEVKSLVKDFSPTDPSAHLDQDLLSRLTGVPNEESVKLLITFYSGMFISTHNGSGSILPDFVDNFLHGVLRRNPQMSLCGAGADELLPEDEIALKEMLVDGSEYELKCVALCGDDIRTATVVVDTAEDEHDKQLEIQLINQLEKLRDTGFDCKNAVGLVFSSLGSKWNRAVELLPTTTAFLHVFPDVPLYGAYCNNPYGYNFLPNFLSADKPDFTVIGCGQNEAGEPLVTLPSLHGGVSFNNPSPPRTVYTLLSLK